MAFYHELNGKNTKFLELQNNLSNSKLSQQHENTNLKSRAQANEDTTTNSCNTQINEFSKLNKCIKINKNCSEMMHIL